MFNKIRRMLSKEPDIKPVYFESVGNADPEDDEKTNWGHGLYNKGETEEEE